MECPACAKELPAGSIVCPFCAAPLDSAPTSMPVSDEAVTSVDPPGTGEPLPAARGRTSPAVSAPSVSMSSSDAGRHGRFIPGTTVAGRYRIVGLLGRGGMGEVYRADDLKLGQPVALKFLPDRLAADADHLERLFDEVRMARKVSHPNVCRVWDIGEAAGHHYVSMEYVDGEDLASLLRRIGRLPEDKAVEIARQLCAALAAAHDEGVLHRDLKPANIMLDGRGKVKLTDFGLAAVAEIRAGTPIYMAPEQLAGEEVSVKSDLYSLGLVLHELLTGKRVYDADNLDELSRQHQSSTSTSLTTPTAVDPAVDRVVQRCLEADPARRPASALAVAAGLPGADPLAAALAAGETPSPEMVAEAGGEGTLPLAIALPLLLLALLAAIVVGVLQSRTSLVGWVPFEMPPVMLDARAKETVADLGYATDTTHTASAFSADLSYIDWLADEGAVGDRWETVTGGRPATLLFWWRSSPAALDPRPGGLASTATVSLNNPPRATPGMISLQLDTLGRLVWLDVNPVRDADGAATDATEAGRGDETGPGAADEPGARAPGETDWAKLFDLMGLEIADFHPVPPRSLPDHFADERAAWDGVFPEDPQAALRIEAAAYAGVPTSVRWFTPWDPLERPERAGGGSGIGLAVATIGLVLATIIMLLTAIFGGLYVAQRNVRSGRGDARGARRLGFAVAVGLAVEWMLGEHSLSIGLIDGFFRMLVFVAAAGGLTWALYLAVEPFMRRHAPQALIGWTRFVDGRFADPLVGREILIGCIAGAASRFLDVVPMLLDGRGTTVRNYVGLPRATVLGLLGSMTGSATVYVILGLGLSFLYGLTFVALGRRPWPAFAVWLLFFGGLGFLPGLTVNDVAPAATQMTSIFWTLGWALALFVLFRRGILTYLVMATTASLLAIALPTLDFSAWYASSSVAGLTLFFAIALYSFYRCAAWGGGLAEALVGD